jgi:hypothetical protein
MVPKLACLLDPRFKTFAFKNKDNSLSGQAMIQSGLTKFLKYNGNCETDHTFWGHCVFLEKKKKPPESVES